MSVRSKSDGPAVLLVASDDYNSLFRLAALLHGAGCRVSLLSPPAIWVAETRYISRRIFVGAKPAQVVDGLQAHLARHRGDYDWVMPMDDLLLRVLARRCGEPWLDDWFPVDSRGRAPQLLVSKVRFLEAMRREGVSMPRSEIVNNLDEARAAALRIGYPVIVKQEMGHGGGGVARAASPAELPAAYAKLRRDGPRIVQVFLPWRCGVTETLFDHGRPVCWLSSYTPRTWPQPFGPSCARQLMNHPAIEDILMRIGRACGLHGFGGFDFLHDPSSGELLVLEMHARATAGLHLGPHAGVDFSSAVRSVLAGEYRVQRPTNLAEPGPELPMFPQDLDRSMRERDWPALFRWLSGTSGCVDVPWSDGRLLRAYAKRTWREEIVPRVSWNLRNPLHLVRRLARTALTAGKVRQSSTPNGSNLILQSDS